MMKKQLSHWGKSALLLGIVVFIAACDRHRSRSTVEEFEHLQSEELSSEEDMLAAFIQRDFEGLDAILAEGMNVDSPVLDGKTLLYLAAEVGDYEMLHFLVSRNADPDLTVNIDKRRISVRGLTEEMFDADEQEIFKAIFALELEKVSEGLFRKMLEELDPGTEFNLSWTRTLLQASAEFTFMDKNSFATLLVGRAFRSGNFPETLDLIAFHLKEELLERWILWSEDPFRNGRYRRAQCRFYESSECSDFEGFLASCPHEMRSRLERARGSIEPYLVTRNILLGCVQRP